MHLVTRKTARRWKVRQAISVSNGLSSFQWILLCGTDGLISLPFLRLVPQRVRDGEPDEERKGKQRQVHHQETNQQEENE